MQNVDHCDNKKKNESKVISDSIPSTSKLTSIKCSRNEYEKKNMSANKITSRKKLKDPCLKMGIKDFKIQTDSQNCSMDSPESDEESISEVCLINFLHTIFYIYTFLYIFSFFLLFNIVPKAKSKKKRRKKKKKYFFFFSF